MRVWIVMTVSVDCTALDAVEIQGVYKSEPAAIAAAEVLAEEEEFERPDEGWAADPNVWRNHDGCSIIQIKEVWG